MDNKNVFEKSLDTTDIMSTMQIEILATPLTLLSACPSVCRQHRSSDA